MQRWIADSFFTSLCDPSPQGLTGGLRPWTLQVVQVKAKYNGLLVELFREVFCHLPLAHCLNSKVLVVHGGLFSQDGVTLDDLRKVDRNM